MTSVPDSMFKYVPPARLDIILNERIAFTPPNRFKDEFDVSPQVKPVTDTKVLRKLRKLAFRRYVKSLPRDQRPSSKRERSELRDGADAHVRGQAIEIANDFQTELPGQISMTFGVLCFSEVCDEDLIWKESADNHRGFVIEFNTAHPAFQAMGQLVQVDYVPHRPIYDFVKGAKGFWHQKLKEKFHHEREWRIIRQLDLCEQRQVNGVPIYLCPLCRATIKAIYFGLHSGDEIENQVRGALVGKNVEFFRAYVENGGLTLSFQKL